MTYPVVVNASLLQILVDEQHIAGVAVIEMERRRREQDIEVVCVIQIYVYALWSRLGLHGAQAWRLLQARAQQAEEKQH